MQVKPFHEFVDPKSTFFAPYEMSEGGQILNCLMGAAPGNLVIQDHLKRLAGGVGQSGTDR